MMQSQKLFANQEKKTLLTVKASSTYFYVYFNDNGKLMRVKIQANETTTVQDFIQEALEGLSFKYKLNLAKENGLFQLYAAKTNGKRCDDMPSLEKTQIICQTNLKSFFLQNESSSQASPLKSKRTIATDFTASKKSSVKIERVQKQRNCFGFCTLF